MLPGIGRNLARPLTAATLVLALLLLAAWRAAPPQPLPSDAPAQSFSARRALAILETLLGDQQAAHPVASPENARVRERILAELKRLGTEPSIQSVTLNTRRGPLPVKNILVRLRGRESAQPILLASHYDSVPMGPGAGDAGASVAAILEIARIIKEGPPPRHDIILLLTEGEEAGLWGARAFVEQHPWAKEPPFVINLEARGTSGPSLMFETSTGNRWLIEAFSKTVPHPRTGSLFYEVYQRLPNDTDFTVFRRAGMKGFNFAFIGDAQNYHTPRDNLDQLDPRSVQHQGENALAALRALDGADWSQSGDDNAVFFDVLGAFTIWWPVSATLPLQLVILGLLLVALILDLRQPKTGLTAKGLAWGLLSVALLLLVPVLISFAIARPQLSALRAAENWPPAPLPTLLFHISLTLLPTVIIARWLAPRAGPRGLWWATWLLWAALATLTAIKLPGGSYLFLVPAAVAALSAMVAALNKTSGERIPLWLVLVPAGLTAALWLPLEGLFYQALGISLTALTTLRAALLLSTLLPLLADRVTLNAADA